MNTDVRKTWGEFWGELLLVKFHSDNPDRWTAREKKARWIVNLLGLAEGADIMELGCGDGLLDICLGRLGMRVLGIDRLQKVLDLAALELKGEQVEFRAADLKSMSNPMLSRDAILIFEVLGLMSRQNDIDMIRWASGWLKPGGSLMIDCPKEPDETSENIWDLPEGRLIFRASYDPGTRIQRILPSLIQENGTTIQLFDPYDPDKGKGEGVYRYIYPVDELTQILEGQGLNVEEMEHFSSPAHYTLTGRKSTCE